MLLQNKATAQASGLNPNDPIVSYDPAHPPVYGGDDKIYKWVRTRKTKTNNNNGDEILDNGKEIFVLPERNNIPDKINGWNGDVYKAYIYKKLSFRLRFPIGYDSSANTKYPLIVFLHGRGEHASNDTRSDPTDILSPLYINKVRYPNNVNGLNYDNDWQLLQGPPEFDSAIRTGKFNGFVLAPQSDNTWHNGNLGLVKQLIDSMIRSYDVDPFRVIVTGLSTGGEGAVGFFINYPLYPAAVIAMSPPWSWAPSADFIDPRKFTPLWITQGNKDNNLPQPWQTEIVEDSFLRYGADFIRRLYLDYGHDTWYKTFGQFNGNTGGEPGYWQMINKSYMSNPWMLYGRDKTYWPGQTINDTIGVRPGLDRYQWRYRPSEGGPITTLPDVGNKIVARAFGIYEARVMKIIDGVEVWSDWSKVPYVIKPGFYEAEQWTATNGLETFSSSVGVGTEVTADPTSYFNLNVGWMSQGDWVEYTINPPVAGKYTLSLRLAAPTPGAAFEIQNSSSVLRRFTVNATGDWQNWRTDTVQLFFPAGPQTLRFQSVNTTGWNINWFQLALPSAPGTLPVKFIYFNSLCRDGLVSLQWKTAQEVNSDRFAVERSADGVHWSEIASVAAAGQSSGERSYSYQDRTGGSSNSLYRIVEYDYNGQTTLSSIVRGNCAQAKDTFSLYPNPSSSSSTLSVSLEHASKLTLRVMDSKGALIEQRNLQLPSGNSSIPLNVSQYAKGIYTVQVYVSYNGEVKTLKLIRK